MGNAVLFLENVSQPKTLKPSLKPRLLIVSRLFVHLIFFVFLHVSQLYREVRIHRRKLIIYNTSYLPI